MPKYLIKGRYSIDGMKGVMKEGGSARRAAGEQAVAAVGGRLEAYYFAFGATDFYGILDLPDEVTAAAIATTLGVSGAFTSLETVVLLTPEQIDEASKRTIDYRPPGR